MNYLATFRALAEAQARVSSIVPIAPEDAEALFRRHVRAVVPSRLSVDLALICVDDIETDRAVFAMRARAGVPLVGDEWLFRSLLHTFAPHVSRERMKAIIQEVL